ncbi:hypothetical protein P6709_02135 [Jeotgalibacillus sp. ET6]|uniref:hypothetical protein n=1 Tax=Jeotgalibacillus sp. ET6 TaxID=3037260 RepID=UPI002418228F|nr:hypothetical protein [Jeotgalibacillus sp. ET6]MDG5470528.1 hypothetical protein [Jeotgalibacillus sp. ET6]
MAEERDSGYFELIAAIIIVLIGLNIFLIFLEKFLDYIMIKSSRYFETKNKKNTNLLEWSGQTDIWIKTFNDISKIKNFEKNDIHLNYIVIKRIIKRRYPTKLELNSLKNYLSIKVKSPLLSALNTSTQTIFLALITSSLIAFFTTISNSSEFKYIYLILFIIFWFALLSALKFISIQISKYELLLLLVSETIDEYND